MGYREVGGSGGGDSFNGMRNTFHALHGSDYIFKLKKNCANGTRCFSARVFFLVPISKF